VIGAATVLAVPIISPARAATFTNTFYGTIVASDTFGDVTTTDSANLFGGGSLLGDPFTLTFTYDDTLITPGTTFFTGGAYPYYFGPNAVTATLTVNGQSTTTGNSSDGFFGNSVYNLQVFTWSPAFGGIQSEGLVIDLAGLPSTDDFSTQFPPGTSGFTDCSSSNPDSSCFEPSVFYTFSGETLVLDTMSINGTASIPEPASLLVLGSGLIGLAGVGSRLRLLRG